MLSVHVPSGDDVTVLVFGPRLEDIHYRTPGFHLNVPRLIDHDLRKNRGAHRSPGKVRYDMDDDIS